MNNEILFKAKTVNGNDWVESMTIAKGTIKLKAHDLFMEISENKWVGIKKDTLSVFTGKIISEKKVFTNDIIKCLFSKTEHVGRLSFGGDLPEYLYGVVTFNQTRMCYQLEFKQPNPHNVISCEFGWGVEQFEHSGNIFDNPELLGRF